MSDFGKPTKLPEPQKEEEEIPWPTFLDLLSFLFFIGILAGVVTFLVPWAKVLYQYSTSLAEDSILGERVCVYKDYEGECYRWERRR